MGKLGVEVGGEIERNSLPLSFSFAVNLKVLQKIKSFLKFLNHLLSHKLFFLVLKACQELYQLTFTERFTKIFPLILVKQILSSSYN